MHVGLSAAICWRESSIFFHQEPMLRVDRARLIAGGWVLYSRGVFSRCKPGTGFTAEIFCIFCRGSLFPFQPPIPPRGEAGGLGIIFQVFLSWPIAIPTQFEVILTLLRCILCAVHLLSSLLCLALSCFFLCSFSSTQRRLLGKFPASVAKVGLIICLAIWTCGLYPRRQLAWHHCAWTSRPQFAV